jgi:hypothetical protein
MTIVVLGTAGAVVPGLGNRLEAGKLRFRRTSPYGAASRSRRIPLAVCRCSRANIDARQTIEFIESTTECLAVGMRGWNDLQCGVRPESQGDSG